jgi:magnesium-transporting ATPase (P-type)
MFLAFGIFLAWGLTYLLSRLDPEWFIENIWTVFWVQFGILTYTLAAGVYLTFALWYAQRKDTPGHSLGQENEEVTTNGNSKPE